MISISRLDGSTLVVNADLIETIEHTGDTVVSLVSGNRFVVRESVAELIDAVVRFRVGVLLAAEAASTPVVREPARAGLLVGLAPGLGEEAKVIPITPGRRGVEGD